MAKKSASKPVQTSEQASGDDLDDDVIYRVTLSKSIQVGRRIVAGENIRLRGDVLRTALATGSVAHYKADA